MPAGLPWLGRAPSPSRPSPSPRVRINNTRPLYGITPPNPPRGPLAAPAARGCLRCWRSSWRRRPQSALRWCACARSWSVQPTSWRPRGWRGRRARCAAAAAAAVGVANTPGHEAACDGKHDIACVLYVCACCICGHASMPSGHARYGVGPHRLFHGALTASPVLLPPCTHCPSGRGERPAGGSARGRGGQAEARAARAGAAGQGAAQAAQQEGAQRNGG